MTDKEKLDKLVAEIERRKKEHEEKKYNYASTDHFWRAVECKELLSFIDSMQEEPQVNESAEIQHDKETCKENGDSLTQEPASEDLYTVAKEYANNITEKIGYRLQLRRAVCFGANWKEQQLMAKAVDATVHLDAGGYPYIPQMELYDYEKDIHLAKEGDKYKVILIKED